MRHTVCDTSTTIIGTQGKIVMFLQIDNKGMVDLANDWSVCGETRHNDVKQYFLWELKQEGFL